MHSVNAYISWDYYNALDEDGKAAYKKGVMDVLEKMERRVVEICTDLHLGGFSMDISFVGMRYRDGHTFHDDDVVALEAEYLNEHDAYAVKVLVKKDGAMQHVAYVASDHARALRRYYGFERAQLRFIENYPGSARYRVTFA